MVLPSYSKEDATSIGSELLCSVMDSGFGYCSPSVSSGGRTAMAQAMKSNLHNFGAVVGSGV